jgi:hypothetical protein
MYLVSWRLVGLPEARGSRAIHASLLSWSFPQTEHLSLGDVMRVDCDLSMEQRLWLSMGSPTLPPVGIARGLKVLDLL